MIDERLRVYSPDECGSDGYPIEWHRSVKHLVRERAEHRCVRCGHPYPPGITEDYPRGEWTPCDASCTHTGPLLMQSEFGDAGDPPWYEPDDPELRAGDIVTDGYNCFAHWRILTVHHLQHGHEAKADLRWWNLAALCQRCHLEIQGKVRLDVPWPWPHSAWFRPYVAGYYAATLGGIEIEPDDTEAIDIWLVAGRQAAAIERMPL